VTTTATEVDPYDETVMGEDETLGLLTDYMEWRSRSRV
jgi:hypothetical protein